ncbi:MAG: pyruvate formate-lyase-activating protein [Huintestinicola sp.]
MNGFIHSTESFGTVDGPGIRFVVFFQGCPMRCQYCHNPDTWEIGSDNPDHPVGTVMTTDELIEKCESVREFLRDGGITATGGEPMLQLPFLTELFEKAKEKGIHTCLDTSGIAFNPEKTDEVDRLLKVTDLIMLDIKHIDDDRHKLLTGHSNKNILAFAKYVSDKKVTMWIRHVVVPEITYNDEYLFKLGQYISQLKSVKALDVLPYHDMAKPKYKNLGIPYPLEKLKPLSKEDAAKARDVIMSGIKDGLEKERQQMNIK